MQSYPLFHISHTLLLKIQPRPELKILGRRESKWGSLTRYRTDLISHIGMVTNNSQRSKWVTFLPKPSFKNLFNIILKLTILFVFQGARTNSINSMWTGLHSHSPFSHFLSHDHGKNRADPFRSQHAQLLITGKISNNLAMGHVHYCALHISSSRIFRHGNVQPVRC